ncbi:SDR family oxidoreductase [Rubripirellula amarantea]|uniref:2-(R)-hydroxypropyl-CoM dehydrogenase n=1 Tax=Rubripirellula amarantea TaxID=2527999 RepID=A0A5C5WUJ4_9BACT|nr:SDR family oxidoreductase [Rubripirellula amarantea]MDA8744247.1 SDR family oxidoreductase [Rubripirellula amarantea]TWT54230.1 2-(R)-hydroxypropyl-CoM dehydrogenase [Rubripirellula amarantea]
MHQSKVKTAIVTGGGAGIGQAISSRLASDGHHVVILDYSEETAAETVESIRASGGNAKYIVTDVGSTESVRDAFDQIPQVDILVNNAGIASIGNLEACTPDELDRVYRVNVKGVYHCLYFAIPKMLESGGGVVLSLASVVSKVAIPDRFAYSMSKGAVLTMTLSVARDYVDKGIRANCICPARVRTPFVEGFLKNSYSDEERPAMEEKLAKAQPIGRMGEPSEIAGLAAFLCSDEASFITGSAYDIDGGFTLLR